MLRMTGMICCVVLLAGLSQPAWAQWEVDISCDSMPCGGGGGRVYQYTLVNITVQSITLTDFCPGTDDLVVGNYSNWLAPAGMGPAATVAPWAALPQPPLSVMYTTGPLGPTPHGAIPPQGGPATAGGVYWSGSVNIPPLGTVTFGFDNVNQAYEDVEWQVNTTTAYTVGLSTLPIAGPMGVFTHGWVHAPIAEEELPEACCMQDGTCQDNVLPSNCTAMGGNPQGPGSVCLGTEACCLPDGTCQDVDALCCDDLGGNPQGPGTACVAATIACCLTDGSCTDVDPLCCDDLGGTPSAWAATCLGDGDGNGIDDACEAEQELGYLFEFSLDIGSDTELSDPNLDVDEGFDPGDVYYWQSAPVVNYNPPPWGLRDGFKDDASIFTAGDPWPSPPDPDLDGVFGPDSAVPVGGNQDPTDYYHQYFDLDGHDQIDVSLWATYDLEGFAIPHGSEIPEWASPCIHRPDFLMISFDDDMEKGWPSGDVPVAVPSPAGVVSYGMTVARDEVIGITLGPMPLPMPVAFRYPIADEFTMHADLIPNPDDGTDRDDDDVDSLDVVPESEEITQPFCPFWYFSADHEATNGLDPGDIYEVSPGFAPIRVVDDVNNLGLPDDVDVDAFEFVFIDDPDLVSFPALAVLFSVDEDDTLTPLIDESGGLDPRAIYGSFLTGFSFVVMDPNNPNNVDEFIPDDIDALTVWSSEIDIPPPPIIVDAWSVKSSPDLVAGFGVIGYGVPMTTGISPESEPRMGGPTLLVFEFDQNVDITNALATFTYPPAYGIPTSGISAPVYGQYTGKLWTQAHSIFPAVAPPTDYTGRTDTLTVAMTGVLHLGVPYGASACLKVTVSGVRDVATLTNMVPITYVTMGLQGDAFGLGGAIGGDGSNNPTDIYQMRIAQSVMGGAIHLDWGAQFQFDMNGDSNVTPTDVYQARLNGGISGMCQ